MYQLFWDDTKAARWKSARITLDVALTTIGISEIAIAADAYRAGRTAYATYVALKSLGDVGVGLTDIVLQNSDYLDNHPDFTKYWNKFVLLYTAGSLSATGIEKLADKYGGKIVINSQQDAEKFYKAAEDAGIDVEQALAKSDDKDEIDKLIEYGDAGALVRNFSLDKINKNVLSALRKQGVTDDEIKRLLELNTISADGIYSDANLKFARNIVEKCFPIPGKGVKMRKILPLEIVEKYHLSSTANVAGSPKTVGGFVAQADHCEVESAGQIFNDFRLDYPDTQFSKNKSFAVIEYENVGNPIRPYNSPDIDGFGLPNTKTGMLGSDEKIIPEFYLGSNPADFPVLREGAILKIYNKDGKVLEQYQLQKNTTWKIY